MYMVLDHGIVCPGVWRTGGDIQVTAQLLSGVLRHQYFITDSKLPYDTDYLDEAKLGTALHELYMSWSANKRNPKKEAEMGIDNHQLKEQEQDGQYGMICTFCGKTAYRKPGAYCPKGWFYIDSHDDHESFANNHISTDGWVVTACSMECAASSWRMGPGDLDKPPEYPRFELERQEGGIQMNEDADDDE